MFYETIVPEWLTYYGIPNSQSQTFLIAYSSYELGHGIDVFNTAVPMLSMITSEILDTQPIFFGNLPTREENVDVPNIPVPFPVSFCLSFFV